MQIKSAPLMYLRSAMVGLPRITATIRGWKAIISPSRWWRIKVGVKISIFYEIFHVRRVTSEPITRMITNGFLFGIFDVIRAIRICFFDKDFCKLQKRIEVNLKIARPLRNGRREDK